LVEIIFKASVDGRLNIVVFVFRTRAAGVLLGGGVSEEGLLLEEGHEGVVVCVGHDNFIAMIKI
jgi:hypothetical protein